MGCGLKRTKGLTAVLACMTDESDFESLGQELLKKLEETNTHLDHIAGNLWALLQEVKEERRGREPGDG